MVKVSSRTSILVPVIVRNGCPSMRSNLAGIGSFFLSRTEKSAGNINSFSGTKTSFLKPFG
jgi:hypothetical protein